LGAEYIRNGLNAPSHTSQPAHAIPIIPADAQAPLAQMSRDEIVALEKMVTLMGDE